MMDFATLFRVESLLEVNVELYKFIEVGLKKLAALVTDKGSINLYFFNANSERLHKCLDYSFPEEPATCMCFEPSGSWVVILDNSNINIVPCLSQFEPNGEYDNKWSHSDVTKLPLDTKIEAIAAAWWLTKNVENIIIIGQKNGTLLFYCVERKSVIAQTEIPEPITNLQICSDNSLEIITLIITGTKKQYRLYLEDRSSGYLWLKATKPPPSIPNTSVAVSPPVSAKMPTVTREKSNFFQYIKQISTDKIALFSQKKTPSQDSGEIPPPSQPEYSWEPQEYVMSHRKETDTWLITAQYVDGTHIVTSYQNELALIFVETVGEETPKHKLLPKIKKAECKQVLWSPKLVYMFQGNSVEVHSTYYSSVPVTGNHDPKFDTLLWSSTLPSDVIGGHLLSPKAASPPPSGWKEPTFICDLIIPRFNLEPCLVVTKSGIYLISTSCDPCEWLVRGIVGGGAGSERAAKGIGAPLPPLLRAASDLVLARGNLVPATFLYELSKSEPNGWVARLGVFGKWQEIVKYRPRKQDNSVDLSNEALFIQILASVLMKINNPGEKVELDTKFPLGHKELEELCLLASTGGLWDVLTTYSVHSGMPHLILASLRHRQSLCRGALRCLLKNDMAVHALLEDDWDYLHSFLRSDVGTFDLILLKHLAIWLCPLRAEFRPIFRDLKQGLRSDYTRRYLDIITTFMAIISEIDKRVPSNEINYKTDVEIEGFKEKFVQKRVLSCGLKFWGYTNGGKVKIMQENVEIKSEIVGRVMDVACGNNHILLLSENGVYACGSNSLGQLGVGEIWPETGSECLAPYPVARVWRASIETVVAGNFHSACIDNKGNLYTWGWNVHGQLGLGNIYDQHTPQIVLALEGKVVTQAACGSCHTTVLTKDHEVWVMGCNMFGQLGTGDRNKHSIPIKVALITEPVVAIAAGHFHNLALTKQDEVLIWGASPQNVRAAAVRAPQPSTSSETRIERKSTKRDLKCPPDTQKVKPKSSACVSNLNEPHLVPVAVDTHNVKGKIVQIAAGWHHSVLLTESGSIYAWGLNFEGQLGTGDRKSGIVPALMKMPEGKEEFQNLHKHKTDSGRTRALINCGGDYTVFIDHNGRIYCTGLNPQESCGKKQEKVMLKMRNTGRMLPVPFVRDKSRFHYHRIGEITSSTEPERETITPYKNPLEKTDHFQTVQWSDKILYLLKSWLKTEMFHENRRFTAKFHYYNRKYTNCLETLLDDVKTDSKPDVPLYLKHSCMLETDNDFSKKMKIEERNVALINIVKKRLRLIGLAILNEEEIPPFQNEGYSRISCFCQEIDSSKLFNNKTTSFIIENKPDQKCLWASRAGFVFDKVMETFPVGVRYWEKHIRITRDFFAENSLPYNEMEDVLLRCMQRNPRVLGAAMLFSEDCFVYNATFTPKFYFKLMNSLIDANVDITA